MFTSSTFTGFPKQCLQFYENLAANNDRDWFNAHKQDYLDYVLAPAVDVQVFEYADEAAAQANAAQVGPDGFEIGTSIVDWIASPHFYKTGKLIVLYVGDDASVKSVLENVLGAQFAGTDLKAPDLPTPKPTP